MGLFGDLYTLGHQSLVEMFARFGAQSDRQSHQQRAVRDGCDKKGYFVRNPSFKEFSGILAVAVPSTNRVRSRTDDRDECHKKRDIPATSYAANLRRRSVDADYKRWQLSAVAGSWQAPCFKAAASNFGDDEAERLHSWLVSLPVDRRRELVNELEQLLRALGPAHALYRLELEQKGDFLNASFRCDETLNPIAGEEGRRDMIRRHSTGSVRSYRMSV